MNKYILCAVVIMCSLSLVGMEEKKPEETVYDLIKSKYPNETWGDLYSKWCGNGIVVRNVNTEDFFKKLTFCMDEQTRSALENTEDFNSFWNLVEHNYFSPECRAKRIAICQALKDENTNRKKLAEEQKHQELHVIRQALSLR